MERLLNYTANSFKEFTEVMDRIKASWGIRQNRIDPEGQVIPLANRLLYRGHQDASWTVRSTLERRGGPTAILQYYNRATKCYHEIEAFLNKTWRVDSYHQVQDKLRDLELLKIDDICLPYIEYLVYLRHHGFPSPLIDWSQSPYIALFFAFENQVDCPEASVMVFIETPEGGKGLGGNRIWSIGQFMSTDIRHFTQRAQYTFAIAKDENRFEFCSHYEIANRSTNQDVLVEIRLPTSIRQSVLRELDQFNINAYTLYGSEDALIRSLAMKYFDL